MRWAAASAAREPATPVASMYHASSPPSADPGVVEAPLQFAVIGDYGTNEPGADTVAALVASWKPDLIATTGDNNYPDGGADTILPTSSVQ